MSQLNLGQGGRAARPFVPMGGCPVCALMMSEAPPLRRPTRRPLRASSDVAAAPSPVKAAEPYKAKGGLVLRLGDFEVYSLIDHESVVSIEAMPKAKTPEEWNPHRHLITPDGKMRAALGGYLIRCKSQGRIVLLDLGMGEIPTKGMQFDAALLKELAAFGHQPADVTDVIFTHLHADHVGWASTGGRPTFANATYWCHQAEWDHWMNNQPTDDDWKKDFKPQVAQWFVQAGVDAVKPIEPLLKTYAGQAHEVFPGLTLRLVPGHTPGHTIVQLDSGGERALLVGDVAHSPMELEDKQWLGAYDTDLALALATRSEIIDEIVRDKVQVAAGHLSGLRFGRIVMTADQQLKFYYNEA
ncbi:MAG: MBL fold metallo-hydrolase [Phenylobacterium sp.]